MKLFEVMPYRKEYQIIRKQIEKCGKEMARHIITGDEKHLAVAD